MPATVLIVDDHASFRASARALLQSEGWEVVGEATDGASGIAAARELKPKVVLLDVCLPGLDGFDVASRLTVDGFAPAVILTSSRDRRDMGSQIERSGARGFIPKAELSAERLEELLQR